SARNLRRRCCYCWPRDSLRPQPRTPAAPAPQSCLPGRLRDAWNFSPQREAPEAQAADAKLAQVSPRTSADLAAVVLTRGELRFSRVLDAFCCSCQIVPSRNRNLKLLTPGTACPCAAAATAPDRQSLRWSQSSRSCLSACPPFRTKFPGR